MMRRMKGCSACGGGRGCWGLSVGTTGVGY